LKETLGMETASSFIRLLTRVGFPILGAFFSLFSFAASFRIGSPMLMVAAALLPLLGLIAWSQPFLISSLFVTFSYFRLQEAYPFVNAMKPALVLGAGSIALVAFKCLLSDDREPGDTRLLRTFCLLSLLGVVGIAYPHALVRNGGASGIDVIGIPTVMLGAAFCAVVWTQLLSSTAAAPLPVNIWLFTAYFSWLSITTIVSMSPSDSYNVWMNNPWKIAAMTLAISWLARSSWDFLVASTVFIIGGVLIAAVVIHNKIYALSLVNGTRVTIGRVRGEDGIDVIPEQALILNDPNDLALILLFPLAFALARVAFRRGFLDALLAATASSAILAGILFTQSRGALLGVIAVFFVLFLQRFKMALPALLAIMIAGPLVFSAMNLSSRDHAGVSEIFDGELEDSAAHRLEAWETALAMAVSRPIRGVGAGNFNGLYRRYTRYWRSREMSTHSMWFQVLAELGFIGLGLFVGMIVTSFVVNARSLARLDQIDASATMRASGIALHAALAGTCVSGTFLSQAHTWPVYVIVGLIGAFYNLVHAPQSAAINNAKWKS